MHIACSAVAHAHAKETPVDNNSHSFASLARGGILLTREEKNSYPLSGICLSV